MTARRLALALLLLAARPAAAQLPTIFPAGSVWKDLFYPKLFWIPREGLTVGGIVGARQVTLKLAWLEAE